MGPLSRRRTWVALCAAAVLGAGVAAAEDLGRVDLKELKSGGRDVPDADAKAGPASVFAVRFHKDPLPKTPIHTQRNPGPKGSGADRAGYTRATIRKQLNVEWNDGGRRDDGQLLFFAEKIQVDYWLDQEVYVSSSYGKDSCPYKVTWDHELGHAGAFLKIYGDSQAGLERVLEESLVKTAKPHTPPRIGTPRDPMVIAYDGKEIAKYQAAVERKIRKVIDAHRAYLMRRLEADRDKRDQPAAYHADYAKCSASDW